MGSIGVETQTALWSVTKSWSNMIIGTLVRDGRLGLNTTLGEIFHRRPHVWANVADADVKRTLTLREIMTMTTGQLDMIPVFTGHWLRGPLAAENDLPAPARADLVQGPRRYLPWRVLNLAGPQLVSGSLRASRLAPGHTFACSPAATFPSYRR